jgi:hypothetical protein
MTDIIIKILTLGLKPIYDKHLLYYQIIKEFRDKLPREHNQAKKLTNEEIDKHPFLGETAKYVTVINTSTHKINISESELDQFYNKLNNFDVSFMFFKKYYISTTKNITRFKSKAKDGDFEIIMLQEVLKESSTNPLKPFDVLVYHFKWKLKLTSPIYIYFIKRKWNKKHKIT